MKSWLSFALWICACFALGETMYAAGRASVMRECPLMQHGDRLLASEQRADATVCTYTPRWNGYGKTIKERKL